MLRILIVSLMLVASMFSGCSSNDEEGDERLEAAIDHLRQRLREPDSLDIIRVVQMASTAGEAVSVYLIEYRARNGFGGMGAGGAVIHVMWDNSIMLFKDKINKHSLTFMIETGRPK